MKSRARQKTELYRLLQITENDNTSRVLDALDRQYELMELLCQCGYTLEEIGKKKLNLCTSAPSGLRVLPCEDEQWERAFSGGHFCLVCGQQVQDGFVEELMKCDMCGFECCQHLIRPCMDADYEYEQFYCPHCAELRNKAGKLY